LWQIDFKHLTSRFKVEKMQCRFGLKKRNGSENLFFAGVAQGIGSYFGRKSNVDHLLIDPGFVLFLKQSL